MSLKLRLFGGAVIPTLALICASALLSVGAEVQSASLLRDRAPFVPLEQQERLFYEGDVTLDEEIPVKLTPLEPLPGVSVGVESIRFYSKGEKLRATVQFVTGTLPDGLHVLARLELWGHEAVRCYDKDSFEVPPGESTLEQVRRVVDVQCCDLRMAEEVVRRFRIRLHAVEAFSTNGLAEGSIALGVRIPVSLKGDLPDVPDAVRCDGLRFEKTEKNDELMACLGTVHTLRHNSRWVADLEVLDEVGNSLERARRVFATKRLDGVDIANAGGRLYLSLGRWTKATTASWFRVALSPAPEKEVESLEAPFEIDRYTALLIDSSTHEVPNLVMLRGIHFEKLEDGQVRATLRAGGMHVANTEWQVRVALLGANGHTLESVEATLTTTKKQEYPPFLGCTAYCFEETEIPLALGDWEHVSAAERFRVSLWPCGV